MPTPQNLGQDKIDIIAACIAAELYHAANVARVVSLTAKNASAISSRAREKTVGFKAITTFINEFAENTIDQANKINQLAVTISRQSIAKTNLQQASRRFKKGWAIAGEDSFREGVLPVISRFNHRVEEIDLSMRGLLRQLTFELEESEMQIRAAGIIATTSKTEASRAGDFEVSLTNIANNIEETSVTIRNHLRQARKLLDAMEIANQ